MDDIILFLYAQGMTTREIVMTFKEMYDADVSAGCHQDACQVDAT
jgi:putative transposase